MRMVLTAILWISVVVLLSPAAARAQPITGDPTRGETVYRRCTACHSLDGTNRVGPFLNGVVGRPAASAAGFPYSSALENAGLTWTVENLNLFIIQPRSFVPMTTMAFAGLSDPQDRADVIAFLAGSPVEIDASASLPDEPSPALEPTSVVFSVLPTSRAVAVGTTATAFATGINSGTAEAVGCTLAPVTSIPATFFFRTTDPSTNQPVGEQNAPVSIAAGVSQSFLFGFTPQAPFAPTEVEIAFVCDNAQAAAVIPGVNTFLLSAAATPVPDVIALAATLGEIGGVVDLPGLEATGAFAVASFNVGATDTMTVALSSDPPAGASATAAAATLPLDLTVCQTNANGACLSPPTGSVPVTIGTNQTPTFAIFARGLGRAIAFDPAFNRLFLNFVDSGGAIRGGTSVAIRTLGASQSDEPPQDDPPMDEPPQDEPPMDEPPQDEPVPSGGVTLFVPGSVTGVEQLAGLKIAGATTAATAQALQDLGAVVVALPASEILPALQIGVIDGAVVSDAALPDLRTALEDMGLVVLPVELPVG